MEKMNTMTHTPFKRLQGMSVTMNILRKKYFLFKSFVKIELSYVFTLKTYAVISNAHLPASGNGESCLGPVFRPLTDSDQHSFPLFLCHISVPTFS